MFGQQRETLCGWGWKKKSNWLKLRLERETRLHRVDGLRILDFILKAIGNHGTAREEKQFQSRKIIVSFPFLKDHFGGVTSRISE